MSQNEIENLAQKRNNILYLVGDLINIQNWIDDGYKDNEGKSETLRMISNRIVELKNEASAILDFIMFTKKKNNL